MSGIGTYPLCNPACRKVTINSELLKDVLTEVVTCMLDVEEGIMC